MLVQRGTDCCDRPTQGRRRLGLPGDRRHRIAPRRSARRRPVPAGTAVATAIAAVRAGASVQLVGKLGDDPAGDAVLVALARAGVGHVALLRDPSRPTPALLRADDDAPSRDAADETDDPAERVEPADVAARPALDPADVEPASATSRTSGRSSSPSQWPPGSWMSLPPPRATGAELIVVAATGSAATFPPLALVLEAPPTDRMARSRHSSGSSVPRSTAGRAPPQPSTPWPAAWEPLARAETQRRGDQPGPSFRTLFTSRIPGRPRAAHPPPAQQPVQPPRSVRPTSSHVDQAPPAGRTGIRSWSSAICSLGPGRDDRERPPDGGIAFRSRSRHPAHSPASTSGAPSERRIRYGWRTPPSRRHRRTSRRGRGSAGAGRRRGRPAAGRRSRPGR